MNDLLLHHPPKYDDESIEGYVITNAIKTTTERYTASGFTISASGKGKALGAVTNANGSTTITLVIPEAWSLREIKSWIR